VAKRSAVAEALDGVAKRVNIMYERARATTIPGLNHTLLTISQRIDDVDARLTRLETTVRVKKSARGSQAGRRRKKAPSRRTRG